MYRFYVLFFLTVLSNYVIAADLSVNVAPSPINVHEVAFGTYLLQPYFTTKEAHAFLLVSKYHNKQISDYRNKQIEQYITNCYVVKKLGDIQLFLLNGSILHASIVVDISGNSARGVTEDCNFLNTFRVGGDYALQKSEPIKSENLLKDGRMFIYSASYFRMLGAVLFRGKTHRILSNNSYSEGTTICAVVYVPSGALRMVRDIPVSSVTQGYDCEFVPFKITFYQKVAIKDVDFCTPHNVRVTESIIRMPIFSTSIPGLRNNNYDDELGNYSTL